MIGETETAILNTVKAVFGGTLRQVDTHPGTWSDVAVRRMLIATPAVYVAWLGCGEGRTLREVESRWVLYVAAEMLNGREMNRLGAYEIIELLMVHLNGKAFGPSTGMRLTKAQNLYTDAQEASGTVLYGLYFSARTPLPNTNDESNLNDFLTHVQTWRLPDGSPEFKAHITVNTGGITEAKNG